MPIARTSLLAVILTLLFSTVVAVGRTNDRAESHGRYLVLIVVDGFRPDYMQLSPMPNLRQLMASGTTYSNAWVGQLESETPTGHATVVTGVYPRKHGVIGFGWRDPTGQNFSWMPTDLRQLNAGNMEALIEGAGVPTLSDLLHRQDPAAKSASVSGEKYYAADAMGAGADYILYGKRVGRGGAAGIVVTPIGRHLLPRPSLYRSVNVDAPPYPDVQDQFVAHLSSVLVQTIRPRMLLVNLPGTDIEGHITGGVIDPNHMRPVVQGVDRAIGRIVQAYQKAGLYHNTVFVVTADHGMLPNTTLVPIKAMYAAVRNTGAAVLEDDFLSTGGYVYLRNPSQSEVVAAGVAKTRFPGVEGVVYKTGSGVHARFQAEPSTVHRLGPSLTRAYIDLANTVAAASGPDVILPYREDAMGLTVAGQARWGNHGGLSWLTQHIPLVVSGPGVRHSQSAFPAQLADIAPTVERLLGFSIPSGVDGVVLADALSAPSGRETAAQQDLVPQRGPDVFALQTHSEREGGSVIVGARRPPGVSGN